MTETTVPACPTPIRPHLRSRWHAIAAVVAAVAAMAVGSASRPADALTRPDFVVGTGVTTRTYPAPSSSNPALYDDATMRTVDPDGCQFSASCDTIPVVFDIPEVGPSDDVRITFEISWDGSVGADLDVFMWDNKQIKDDPAPEESPYFLFTDSATSNNPEGFEILNPSLDRYNLTINAWLSGAPEVTIRTEMFIAEFNPPFEDLGDPPVVATTSTTEAPATTTTTTPSAVTTPTIAPPTTLPPIDLGSIESGFGEFDGIDVTQEFPDARGQVALGTAQPAAAETEPPSTALVMAVTFGFPALILGPGWFWLQRRRRALGI